eukprot:COSAG01_NODE_5494_length_4226_cov_23.703174_1_plen_893_part_10
MLSRLQSPRCARELFAAPPVATTAPADAALAKEDTYLQCPYRDEARWFSWKEKVKTLGARFDEERKAWYVPEGTLLEPFRGLLPQQSGLTRDGKVIVDAELPKRYSHRDLRREFGCDCSASRCLKLYCKCFRSGKACGPLCTCWDCGNGALREQHPDWRKAEARRKATETRRRKAAPTVREGSKSYELTVRAMKLANRRAVHSSRALQRAPQRSLAQSSRLSGSVPAAHPPAKRRRVDTTAASADLLERCGEDQRVRDGFRARKDFVVRRRTYHYGRAPTITVVVPTAEGVDEKLRSVELQKEIVKRQLRLLLSHHDGWRSDMEAHCKAVIESETGLICAERSETRKTLEVTTFVRQVTPRGCEMVQDRIKAAMRMVVYNATVPAGKYRYDGNNFKRPDGTVAVDWDKFAERSAAALKATPLLLMEVVTEQLTTMAADLINMHSLETSLRAAGPCGCTDREVVLRAMRAGIRSAIEYASLEVRADREIGLLAVTRDVNHFPCATETQRADRDIALVAVRQHGPMLQHVLGGLRADQEVVLAATKHTAEAFRFADDSLRGDPELVKVAAKLHSRVLHFCRLCDDRDFMVSMARQNFGTFYDYASQRLQSDPKYILAVATDTNHVLHAYGVTRRDRDFVLQLVTRCGMQLRDALLQFRADPQVVLAAVTQNGNALEFAEMERWSQRNKKTVIMAAVTQAGAALRYVQYSAPELLESMSVVKAAVAQDGTALRYARGKVRTKRVVVLAAITQDSRALQYIDEKLRYDNSILGACREGVRAMIANDVDGALKFASQRWRADRETVMAAIKRDPLALRYASDELRADPDVVVEAVRRNADALRYTVEAVKSHPSVVAVVPLKHVSQRWRADRETVMAAIKRDPLALRYASDELRADPD